MARRWPRRWFAALAAVVLLLTIEAGLDAIVSNDAHRPIVDIAIPVLVICLFVAVLAVAVWAQHKERMIDLSMAELFAALRRPEVIAAMADFYQDVDARIAAKNPTCWNRGLCCRFGQYGHRLYVTALEVSYYLARGNERPDSPPLPLSPSEPGAEGHTQASGPAVRPALLEHDTCPHAFGGICHARDGRPLGCRIFFCDPAAQAWQGPLTEELLARLRAMHQELNVPYFYADWISVLLALTSADPARQDRGASLR